MVVFKYDLSGLTRNGKQEVALYRGSEVLDIRVQDSAFGTGLKMWALVPDQETVIEQREFIIAGTGDDIIPFGATYVKTVEIGAYVFHIFELA